MKQIDPSPSSFFRRAQLVKRRKKQHDRARIRYSCCSTLCRPCPSNSPPDAPIRKPGVHHFPSLPQSFCRPSPCGLAVPVAPTPSPPFSRSRAATPAPGLAVWPTCFAGRPSTLGDANLPALTAVRLLLAPGVLGVGGAPRRPVIRRDARRIEARIFHCRRLATMKRIVDATTFLSAHDVKDRTKVEGLPTSKESYDHDDGDDGCQTALADAEG